MSNIDQDIVKDFIAESKAIVHGLLQLLESIEGDFSEVKKLEDYGQQVDRINGGAKSLAMLAAADHPLHMIGAYAELCKAVGYKASQIDNNPRFYDVCVALLLDATEMLKSLLEKLEGGETIHLKDTFSITFIERLRWVSNQFGADVRSSVDAQKGGKKMDQNEIDELMRKLGVV